MRGLNMKVLNLGDYWKCIFLIDPVTCLQLPDIGDVKCLFISLSHVWLFVTPWAATCQASLPFTISQSLFKLMSIMLMMPSNHLILCSPLLLLPSIFPSIRGSSNESAVHITWPKYLGKAYRINILPKIPIVSPVRNTVLNNHLDAFPL